MNILWLAWKDYTHPQRGGAEVILRELMLRQVADGHQVTLLTARHPGSTARQIMDGITVIRVGSNRYLHPLQALWYYLRQLRGRYDLVIETVNTAPYLSSLFRHPGARHLTFYHQLAREIWFFEAKKPLSYLGYYVIEPLATWLLARSKTPLITVSDSTKRDLARFGWDPRRTHVIREGIDLTPLPSLDHLAKFTRPTVLSFGAMRGMKRTLDQIEAFEQAKKQLPDLQLKLAGDASSDYGQQVLQRIAASPYSNDIEYLGRVDLDHKRRLMQQAQLIIVTSVKEGWGLIVSEAASQGTPAVVYDVDGLRDSVKHQQTGLVTAATPAALAAGITTLLQQPTQYAELQRNAWEWSKELTFDHCYQDFKTITEGALA